MLDIQREVDSKANIDQKQDQLAQQVLREMEQIKQEMNDVLTTKINENHALIEESAR